jgi:ATP-binding cassette subfamily C protein LapB
MDGPKDRVLAALSGAKPAASAAPAAAPGNLHMHPSARPVEREASV